MGRLTTKSANLGEMKTLHPESKIVNSWSILIVLTTIYNYIFIPFQMATKGSIISNSVLDLGFFLDLGFDSILIFDLLLRFNVGYIEKGQFINDKAHVRKNYLQTDFKRHLLSCIPIDIVARLFYPNLAVWIIALLRIPRLLRVFDSLSASKVWEDSINSNPVIVRLLRLLFVIFLVEHWVACIWFLIRNINISFHGYLQALYWSVMTLTTVGYGNIAAGEQTVQELGFTISVMMLGVTMYAFIIGNVASVITDMNASRSRFREKLDRIQTYLREKKVPQGLQKKVRSYYQYMWEYNRDTSTDFLSVEQYYLNDLPRSLSTQISLCLNQKLIESVPMFKGAEPQFIEQILAKLRPIVLPSEDYVIHEGQIGHEMYFINHGEVQVFSEKDNKIIENMESGSFFGELALLDSVRRTASVKTLTYCELFVLEKSDFAQVMADYPNFADKIEEIAEKRRQENQSDSTG